MEKKHSIIGSGEYNYDKIVIREYPDGFVPGQRNRHTDKMLIEEVGGTCGNVMAILGVLGWKSQPQVKLIDSNEGQSLAASLQSFGCDTSYVSLVLNGGFSALEVTHRRNRQTGNPEIGIKSSGPNGSRFRKVTELRAKDEVPALLARIEEVPDVYFFDHNEAGPRAIAQALRERGSLVYYECENSKDWPKAQKCIETADIVKFSDERLADITFTDDYPDKLFIQTMGSKGLRFCLRGGEWYQIDAAPVEKAVDTEGCGDTITAIFLDQWAKLDFPCIAGITVEQVKQCLEVASQYAARCVQYYGSKGWLHAEHPGIG